MCLKLKNIGTQKYKERDYFFDNLRFMLIFCVVLCHGIETVRYTSHSIVMFHETLLCFVMPMFMFVTGYFSKNMSDNNNISKRIKILNLLLLFFACQLIKNLIFGYDTFLKPHYGNWYLAAMVVYYYILPTVAKFKKLYVMIISVGIAVLIGNESDASTFMQCSRIVCFFPFFIFGYYCSKDMINKIKERKYRIIGAIVLLICIFVYNLCFVDTVPIGILHANKSYIEMDITVVEGLVFRIGWYVFSSFMCFGVLSLIPRKKLFISFLGQRTLSIYIIHTIMYSVIIQYTDMFDYMGELHNTLLIFIIFSAIVTLFCSNILFVKILDVFMNIKFFWLLKDREKLQ